MPLKSYYDMIRGNLQGTYICSTEFACGFYKHKSYIVSTKTFSDPIAL